MGGRWTEARRRVLVDSRVQLTKQLVGAIAEARPRPKTLISESAVGYYGDRGNEVLHELSPGGTGFLMRVLTGATGFIGRALVPFSAAVNIYRRGLFRSPQGMMVLKTHLRSGKRAPVRKPGTLHPPKLLQSMDPKGQMDRANVQACEPDSVKVSSCLHM